MPQFGPYLEDTVYIRDYLAEKRMTKSLELDADEAYDIVNDAVSKYEQNVELFASVLSARLSTSTRDQEGYDFQPAKINLQNIDKSFKSLHYKVEIRDVIDFKAVVWLEFLNEKVRVLVSYNKKRLGDTWTNNTRDAEKFAKSLLPNF